MINYSKRNLNIMSLIISTIIFILLININFMFKKNNFNPNSIIKLFKRDLVEVEIKSDNINKNTNESSKNQNNYPTKIFENKTKDESWKIIIPSISLEANISEGTEKETMNKYVGHFEETSRENGNVGLAAHNRGYNVNYFSDIKKLKEGDEIIYKYNKFEKIYKVTKHIIIKDTDWNYLKETEENKITLITCVENEPEYRRCIQGIEK